MKSILFPMLSGGLFIALLFVVPAESAFSQADSLKVCVSKKNGSIKAKTKCKNSKETTLTEKGFSQGAYYVATSGAKYTDIQTAIDDAADNASAAAPALVKIGPGKFTITSSITMADYVSLEGSGVGVTIIEPNTEAAINLASNTSVRNLTVSSTHADGATLMSAAGVTGSVEIENVKLKYDGEGGIAYGIFTSFASVKLNNVELEMIRGASDATFGIDINDSPDFSANNVRVTMVDGTNRAMMIRSGTVANIRNSTFKTSTANGTDQTHGLYISGSTTTAYVQGLKSESTETGSGLAGAAWIDDSGSVIIKDSYFKTVGSGNASMQANDGSVVHVLNSTIVSDSGLPTVATSETTTVSIASSQLSGGAVSVSGGSSITCAGISDENFAFTASSCP